jgi:pimeloyl-ACP methyl ester carboxylesterase
VWDTLFLTLDRTDVKALRLPGFGSPLPTGFDATMDQYAAWLATAVRDFDEVDLVGHDWGGLLILRLMSERPDNVRSWIVDSGDLTPDFTWHDGGRAWQTAGRGEELAGWLAGAPLEDRVQLLVEIGVVPDAASRMARAVDPTMATAMLRLYRSAVDIGASWGPALSRITRPGLCVEAGRDPFRPAGAVRRLSSRLDAALVQLPDSGHFWMLDDPARTATAFQEFWATLASSPSGA